jgi:hypothetical protein
VSERAKPARITPEPDAGHVPITEEFDRAKWTLPPPQVILVALVIVAVALAAVSWFARARPTSAGSIGEVAAVEMPDHNNVLAIVQFTIHNVGRKSMWIRDITAKLVTDKGEWTDVAANKSDLERYYKGFPELRQHAAEPFVQEMKIQPGGQQSGMILVGFPVSKDAFEHRKSLSVTVDLYDQRPLLLTK